jgi:chorismate synthase
MAEQMIQRIEAIGQEGDSCGGSHRVRGEASEHGIGDARVRQVRS